MNYEYGVAMKYDVVPHRTFPTLDLALQWIDEWIHMGGREDAFRIIRRQYMPWEDVNVD